MNDTSNSVSVLEPPQQPQNLAAVGGTNLPGRNSSFLGWVERSWPTALVLALLVAVGLWGHSTGWKIPKFADLFGGPTDDKGDWCKEHGVAESICVECNDKLMPRVKDHKFCKVHGVHNCPFENPDVIQMPYPPYEVTDVDLERFDRAMAIKDRPKNNSKWIRYQRRIQLASQEAFLKLDIQPAEVRLASMTEGIAVSGEITYAQPKVAPQNIPVAGRVLVVTSKGQLGEVVQEKDLLALVEAPEVGKVKSEFAQAVVLLDQRSAYFERVKPLYPASISEAKFREAETAVRESQIQVAKAQQELLNFGLPLQPEQFKGLLPAEINTRLQLLGLSAAELKALNLRTQSANLLPVRASAAGIVTEAKVTPGKGVEPATPLFVIADNKQMWLLLNVRVEDAKFLSIRDAQATGNQVEFHPEGSRDKIRGELIWKSSAVDKVTRTVQFRAVVDNPKGTLFAETFGSGTIILRRTGEGDEPKSIVVPNDAVHWDGESHLVFVQDKDFDKPGALKVFHVRSVRPGVRDDSYTEIIAGLIPGEYVAARNSAILRGELLKSALGDG